MKYKLKTSIYHELCAFRLFQQAGHSNYKTTSMFEKTINECDGFPCVEDL